MRRFRRRRRARSSATELARLLIALDELAAEARPWRGRRGRERLSAGAAR